MVADSPEGSWPDDQQLTGASFARIDTTISCVFTRFRLRSRWSLIPFYVAFRRVRRASSDIGGLLQSVFLVEDLKTCYTLSFWKDEWSIVEFGTKVRAHVEEANYAFSRVHVDDAEQPEIWSAQFRLWAVSCHNLNWKGLDLQPLLSDQWEKRSALRRVSCIEELKPYAD